VNNVISVDEARILLDAAKELKEAQEQIPQLQSLLRHPGWDIVRKVAEGQINARQREVMGGPVESGRSVNRQEWLKGEASGMRLLLGLPNLLIEQADDTLQEIATNDAPLDDTESGNSGDTADLFAPGD
jgi:hypothetical protein